MVKKKFVRITLRIRNSNYTSLFAFLDANVGATEADILFG